jgi:RNA polymerase sigma-70 factor (ECF subfamily)
MVATAEQLGVHQRLQAHSIVALAEVYDQYAPSVFGVALRVTNDRQAAEDITQDVLLALWRVPERYGPAPGGLRPWLATVAHRRSLEWIRAEARGRDRSDLDLVLTEEDPRPA